MYGFISGLSILFQSSIYLFLCQYHTVLVTIALQYSWKSGSVMPLALLFLLRTVLAIWSFLWLHTNFRIVCFISVTNAVGILSGIALNLQTALSNKDILTLLILPIYEHEISFHSFVLSISSIKVRQFSAQRSYTSLVKFITKYFTALVLL